MEQLFCIYFIIMILSLFFNFIMKVKRNVLCCGLVGFAGWEKPDLNKLKILFFANDARGGDSCGYYYNRFINKGIGTTNTSYKLLQKEIITNEEVTNFIFIGHTRRGSVGNVSIENAHPFNIDNRWIVAHNGTLDNWKELCDKYDVDYKDIHVDSKALATLIDKQGFGILNEYRGYAALLMHNLKEPNAFYVYHGASKKYKQGELLEERPLFFMETNEGVYFSSIQEALNAIRDDEKQESFKLIHNKVVKFVYGSVDEEGSYMVERENNNIDIDVKAVTVYPQNNLVKAKEITFPPIKTKKTPTIDELIEEGMDIFKESLPKRASEFPDNDKIVYYRNQYWKVSGGTVELARDTVFADKRGVVYKFGGNGIGMHRFVNGYYFETEALAREYREYLSSPSNDVNVAYYTSKFTKYAVVNPQQSAKELYVCVRNRFFLKGKPANTSIQPLFSDRTYVYREGVLLKITSDVEEEVMDAEPKETKVVNLRKDISLKFLSTFLEKRWISRQQINDDLPPEVLLAIRLYVEDMYAETLNDGLSEHGFDRRMNRLTGVFLDETVNSKFTFSENMTGGKAPIEYLKKALLMLEDTEDIDYRNADDDFVESVDRDIEEMENDRLIKDFLQVQAPGLLNLAEALRGIKPFEGRVDDINKTLNMCKEKLTPSLKRDIVKRINQLNNE